MPDTPQEQYEADKQVQVRRANRLEGIASKCEAGEDWRSADRFWRAAAVAWWAAGDRKRMRRCDSYTDSYTTAHRAQRGKPRGG